MALGNPGADFVREGGTGEHRDRAAGAELLVRDLMRQLTRRELEALGGEREAHAACEPRRDAAQHAAQRVARHGDQHVERPVEGRADVGHDAQGSREIRRSGR